MSGRHRACLPLLFAASVAASLLTGTASADLRYRAEITGASGELADLLDRVSELKTLEDRLPASEEALRRRAEADLERLADAAHSLGYWDARFSYSLDPAAQPAKVTVTVVPGPLYRVSAVMESGPDDKPLAFPEGAPPLPLKPGDPARTAPVLAAEAAILAALANAGHPFAQAKERHVVIDRGQQTMAVSWTVDPGPLMRFGSYAIEGLERLDPEYVERRLRWREGEVYDARKVEETRRVLLQSGLFSTVHINPTPQPGEPDRAAVSIDASERAHRTVGAGIGYNTSQGAGARIFWENRDLFGEAEYLNLTADIGQQLKGVSANFRKPDFLLTDQDLLALAEVAEDTPTAYHSRRARVSAGLERRFSPFLAAGLALSLEKANVVQLASLPSFIAGETTQHYTLLGIPMFLRFDTTDDLLNPARGWRLRFEATPYRSFSGPDLTFVSERLAGSTYWPLDSDGRVILAGRAALASIEGASLAALPADKRIYAGGGGSIRAYGYQLAGPLDSNDKPLGGKSSLELSLEFRVRLTDTIGLVPFLDAGSFYEKSIPQIGHRLLWGPGLGLRYYTGFGPVRLDLATPLEKRGGDSPIQVYISIGQAF